jgi:hypothetical protein
MAANYGTNPTNPVNQAGGQMPAGQGQPDQPIPTYKGEPKSIRDYLSMARSPGAAPSFTNKPGGEGLYMEEPAPQAIPEAPQSEYEKMPFAQRMKINPYMRAQERVKTMMPELFQSMFPGMQQGAFLEDYQMEQWQGAVGKLTGNLLKHYDKQYEWSLKNENVNKTGREKDRRFWQSKYVDAKLRGQPAINEETGMPLTETEFVNERISSSDEMRFKEEMEGQENAAGGEAGLSSMSPQDVGAILSKNPDLMKEIKYQVLSAISDAAGRSVTEEEFDSMKGDPGVQQIIQDVLKQNEARILELR